MSDLPNNYEELLARIDSMSLAEVLAAMDHLQALDGDTDEEVDYAETVQSDFQKVTEVLKRHDLPLEQEVVGQLEQLRAEIEQLTPGTPHEVVDELNKRWVSLLGRTPELMSAWKISWCYELIELAKNRLEALQNRLDAGEPVEESTVQSVQEMRDMIEQKTQEIARKLEDANQRG